MESLGSFEKLTQSTVNCGSLDGNAFQGPGMDTPNVDPICS